MNASDNQAPNDADFFMIFEVLRESKAIISEGFSRKVTQELMKLVDDTRLASPSILDMVGQVSMDSLNIIGEGAIGRPRLRDPSNPLPTPKRDAEDDDER